MIFDKPVYFYLFQINDYEETERIYMWSYLKLSPTQLRTRVAAACAEMWPGYNADKRYADCVRNDASYKVLFDHLADYCLYPLSINAKCYTNNAASVKDKDIWCNV